MVNISEPEGTVFDTLLSSIMKKILLFVILIGASVFASCGNSSTESSAPPASPAASKSPSKSLPKIIAFGDSLTAGYGLDPADSYPSVLQKRLDADGFKYEVVNAGVSGDTSAGGVRRIDWAMEGDVRVVVLELGANDILRFQPIAEMKKNLSQIILRAKAKGARVLLAGMEAPTNAGPEYRREAREAFIELAREHKVELIPFFLEGVGGVERLNQPDGIHPNAEGTKIVTENVYKHLRLMLEK
jgi:acyl-CoA thioesterase-1